MSVQGMKVMVPPPVPVPRAAVWAGTLAAWTVQWFTPAHARSQVPAVPRWRDRSAW